MAEYIERDSAIEYARLHYCKDCNCYNGIRCGSCGFDDAILLIEGVHAADVVEVRHGEWIDWHMVKTDRRAKEYPSVRCTNCGIVFCDLINNHNYMYRYCPHCGAKMDGKGDK